MVDVSVFMCNVSLVQTHPRQSFIRTGRDATNMHSWTDSICMEYADLTLNIAPNSSVMPELKSEVQ